MCSCHYFKKGIESQQTFHDFAQLNPLISYSKMTLKEDHSDWFEMVYMLLESINTLG